MSTKNTAGDWDPTLQNWFNMQLGTEGLYGNVYKGDVDCSSKPCSVLLFLIRKVGKHVLMIVHLL